MLLISPNFGDHSNRSQIWQKEKAGLPSSINSYSNKWGCPAADGLPEFLPHYPDRNQGVDDAPLDSTDIQPDAI